MALTSRGRVLAAVVAVVVASGAALALKEQARATGGKGLLDIFKLTGDVVPSSYPVLKFNQSVNNDSTFAAQRRRELRKLQDESLRLMSLQRRGFNRIRDGVSPRVHRPSIATEAEAMTLTSTTVLLHSSSSRLRVPRLDGCPRPTADSAERVHRRPEGEPPRPPPYAAQELEILEEDAKIYKSTGPVLTRQSKGDAVSTISKRIEYISGEIDDKAKAMSNLQSAIEEKCKVGLVGVGFDQLPPLVEVGGDVDEVSVGEEDADDDIVAVLAELAGDEDVVFVAELVVVLGRRRDLNRQEVADLDSALGRLFEHNEHQVVLLETEVEDVLLLQLIFLRVVVHAHGLDLGQLKVRDGGRLGEVHAGVVDREAVVGILDTVDQRKHRLVVDHGEGVEGVLGLVEHAPLEEGTNLSGTVGLAVHDGLLPEDEHRLTRLAGDRTAPERSDDTEVAARRAIHGDAAALLALDVVDVGVFNFVVALHHLEFGHEHHGLLDVGRDAAQVQLEHAVGGPLGDEGAAAAALAVELQKVETVPLGVVVFLELADDVPHGGHDGKHGPGRGLDAHTGVLLGSQDDFEAVGAVLLDVNVGVVDGGAAVVLRVDDLVLTDLVLRVEGLVDGAAALVVALFERLVDEGAVAVVVPVLPRAEDAGAAEVGQRDDLTLVAAHDHVAGRVDGGNHLAAGGHARGGRTDTFDLQLVRGVREGDTEEVVLFVDDLVEVRNGPQHTVVESPADRGDLVGPRQLDRRGGVDVKLAGELGDPKGLLDREPGSRGAGQHLHGVLGDGDIELLLCKRNDRRFFFLGVGERQGRHGAQQQEGLHPVQPSLASVSRKLHFCENIRMGALYTHKAHRSYTLTTKRLAAARRGHRVALVAAALLHQHAPRRENGTAVYAHLGNRAIDPQGERVVLSAPDEGGVLHRRVDAAHEHVLGQLAAAALQPRAQHLGHLLVHKQLRPPLRLRLEDEVGRPRDGLVHHGVVHLERRVHLLHVGVPEGSQGVGQVRDDGAARRRLLRRRLLGRQLRSGSGVAEQHLHALAAGELRRHRRHLHRLRQLAQQPHVPAVPVDGHLVGRVAAPVVYHADLVHNDLVLDAAVQRRHREEEPARLRLGLGVEVPLGVHDARERVARRAQEEPAVAAPLAELAHRRHLDRDAVVLRERVRDREDVEEVGKVLRDHLEHARRHVVDEAAVPLDVVLVGHGQRVDDAAQRRVLQVQLPERRGQPPVVHRPHGESLAQHALHAVHVRPRHQLGRVAQRARYRVHLHHPQRDPGQQVKRLDRIPPVPDGAAHHAAQFAEADIVVARPAVVHPHLAGHVARRVLLRHHVQQVVPARHVRPYIIVESPLPREVHSVADVQQAAHEGVHLAQRFKHRAEPAHVAAHVVEQPHEVRLEADGCDEGAQRVGHWEEQGGEGSDLTAEGHH
ncbi:prefoldin subunit [Babesia caballi]|uniref:Prefoldin subunit n=1 Tax=Babesia caballi TaxID=5871 RepID=A0AAV4M2F4_BABCB|nr:prefoldin subunit [Babesia caballi]